MKHSWLKLLVVGLASACGLVVEIVAGRMIAPYLGMSLYTWTAIISVVLAGFSVGHWIGGEFAGRPRQQAMRLVAWSLILAGVSTAASLIIIRTVVPSIIQLQLDSVSTVLLVTLLLFFLPSLFVGIPSPVLTKLAIDEADPGNAGRVIGAFFAVGAVGSIAGTLLAGFLFIGWLGVTATLLLVAALYVCLGLALFADRRSGHPKQAIAPSVALLIGATLVGFVGWKVRAFAEPCRVGSTYYCIRVVDVSQNYGTPARLMVLDHLGHGINVRDNPRLLVSPYVELQDALTELHIGKRALKRAFFIGGGAYTLPRAWSATYPDAEISVAEIDPEVSRTAVSEMWLGRAPNVKTIVADARVALQLAPAAHFDVIIGDAFHDIVIPAHLVTREFFSLVQSRLTENGIYLMNVVDNRREPRLALSILDSMRASMPTVEMWASNETGERATFILAGVRRATGRNTLASVNTPQAHFIRIPKDVLAALSKRLTPMVLTDDHAPVDRLIGVE